MLGAKTAILVFHSKCAENNKMDYERENSNELYQYYELDEEMKDMKSKLLECQSKCEDTVIEMCDVSQLKDKGTFILKGIVGKYNDLDKELYQIHCNYIKCAEKIDSHEEYVIRKIESLTLRRDNLKEELSELKRKADENDKILTEIRKMITIQEKKNTALMRKLRKQVANMHISPNLEEKVNTILNDPRVTNTKISKQ